MCRVEYDFSFSGLTSTLDLVTSILWLNGNVIKSSATLSSIVSLLCQNLPIIDDSFQYKGSTNRTGGSPLHAVLTDLEIGLVLRLIDQHLTH